MELVQRLEEYPSNDICMRKDFWPPLSIHTEDIFLYFAARIT
jgi:hypothetical protein